MVTGAVGGVAVDSQNRIWIAHRPGTLGKAGGEATAGDTLRNFGKPAPSLLQFAQDGTLLRTMGGPGAGYEWITTEHGVYVDGKGSIWVNGSGARDHHILKFAPDGKFLLQIGRAGQSKGSNDTQNLGAPAGIDVDDAANEVYVADGYRNRRVIVFDATTGAYKRHWGAYGNKPDDTYDFGGRYLRKLTASGPLPTQFHTPVHCAKVSKDGLVYVCDRTNGRVQVFRKDGTFVKEFLIFPRVTADLGFSADAEQRFMYVTDFIHEKVWILRRADGTILGSFGRPGHYGGAFTIAHSLAVDRNGHIYVTESLEGKRVQRFLFKGLGFADASETVAPAQYEGRFDPSR